MKFTIGTELMKDVVARAIKGAGNNKLIPITGMMCIRLQNGDLTVITTDATNYLYIKEQHVAGDDFYVVVDANQFAKLVGKMTSDNITMTVDSNFTLTVKGNGTYKIELPIDEDGNLVKFPDTVVTANTDKELTLNRSTIQVILETIKPALAVTMENPQYTAYYMADKVVATDSYKIASLNIPIFDEPRLVSSELIDLVSVMRAEKIATSIGDTDIVLETPDCTIVGKFADGLDDFAIEPISNLVNQEFDSFCSVPKNELLQTLDRLSLFVGTYDKNAVDLTFTKEGLQISSKASSGVEIINYISSNNHTDYTCAVDILMLIQEVKAIQNDKIEMYYGDDSSIKLVDGNITIVIALMDDESDYEEE